jgi:hypothetical protein
MTKRQAREFYWFSLGFASAALRLRQAAFEQDPAGRKKETHLKRGAAAAAMLFESDLKQKQKEKP